MACFLVPVGEAIVITVAQKMAEKQEKKTDGKKSNSSSIKWSWRLSWLNKMLWGGSILLIVDHIRNGEVVFRLPFFTALGETGGLSVMLREMATLGVAMAGAVTAVWGIMILIAELRTKAQVRRSLQ